MALVWILPLAVVFLNSDYLNAKIYDRLEKISDRLAWFPSKDSELNEVAVFFALGAGLEGTRPARQNYFSHALNHRLRQQDLQELLSDHELTVEISSNSTYTKLYMSSAADIEIWFEPVINGLRRVPKIDWNQLRSNVEAELHVLAAQDRWKLITAAVGKVDEDLSPAIYEQAWEQLARTVIRSSKKPTLTAPQAVEPLIQRDSDLYPLELQLSTRKDTGTDLLVWQLPRPENLERYLTEQIVGQIISTRLAQQRGTRWLLRIDAQTSLALLETPLGESNEIWHQLMATRPTDEEIKQASEAFNARWKSFTQASPLDWPGILMMNGYTFADTEEALATLTEQGLDPFMQVWQILEQPALRKIEQIPLSESR